MTQTADQRQHPLGVGVLAATDRQAEPGRVGELAVVAGAALAAVVELAGRTVRTTGVAVAAVIQIFRFRQAGAVHAHQGGGDLLGRLALHQGAGEGQVLLRRRFGQGRVVQHADGIAGANLLGAGRTAPDGLDAGVGDQHLGLAAAGIGHQQDGHALLAGATRAA